MVLLGASFHTTGAFPLSQLHMYALQGPYKVDDVMTKGVLHSARVDTSVDEGAHTFQLHRPLAT